MNPEVKEKWIAALESGEFNQGTRSLRNGQNYCCLGVLCELAVREGAASSRPPASEGLDWEYGNPGGWDGGLLPENVSEWAGLDVLSPTVTHEHSPWALAALNDRGMPFTEIAGLIREQL